jgi:probable HAF family extracellular repeat protein
VYLAFAIRFILHLRYRHILLYRRYPKIKGKLTGWVLNYATAINDAGQIVGYGDNPEGITSAFILTPVPEPEVYLMMGVGVCLASVIARRRKQISQ